MAGQCEVGYNTDLVLETRVAGTDKRHNRPAPWTSQLTVQWLLCNTCRR
jgi:hypothetical protein